MPYFLLISSSIRAKKFQVMGKAVCSRNGSILKEVMNDILLPKSSVLESLTREAAPRTVDKRIPDILSIFVVLLVMLPFPTLPWIA